MPPTPPSGPWEPATVNDAPAPFVEEKKPLYKRLLAPVLVVAYLIWRVAKYVLIFGSKAKFLTTSLSMIVSIGAYTLIWGWKFAVGFVLLLYVHEMGHYIQLRREGIKPGRMIFVPFLGAVISAKSLGGNALAEARVALAGPILGSLAAAALIPVGAATGEDFWYALAFTGLFLNLFNLLPVVPLDGGRAFAALAPWMWFVGLGAMVTLVFVLPNPIIILIALFTMIETYRRWKNRKAGEEGNADYYKVKPKHRVMVFAVYMTLVVLLVVGMDLTFVERDFDDV
jgi:Zn-dependent protease